MKRCWFNYSEKSHLPVLEGDLRFYHLLYLALLHRRQRLLSHTLLRSYTITIAVEKSMSSWSCLYSGSREMWQWREYTQLRIALHCCLKPKMMTSGSEVIVIPSLFASQKNILVRCYGSSSHSFNPDRNTILQNWRLWDWKPSLEAWSCCCQSCFAQLEHAHPVQNAERTPHKLHQKRMLVVVS